MNIGIIGSGVYAVALMHALEKKNEKIKIWTHDENILDKFNKTHKLESSEHVEISDKVSVYTNINEVIKNSDIIYIVTTSKFFNQTIKNIKNSYNNSTICIATKGLDEITNSFLSETVENVLNTNKVCAISGPSFAVDITNDEIISLTLGSKNKECLEQVKKSIHGDTIFISETEDILGIQLCNTYKNIIAIASGLLNGLGYTNSTNAFFITKAINELTTLIVEFDGNKETVFSSAGIGDLLLTCTSEKSRNYSFGKLLAEKNITDIDLTEITVEGYHALLALKSLLLEHNIESKLLNLLYNIIHNIEDKNNLITYLKK